MLVFHQNPVLSTNHCVLLMPQKMGSFPGVSAAQLEQGTESSGRQGDSPQRSGLVVVPVL